MRSGRLGGLLAWLRCGCGIANGRPSPPLLALLAIIVVEAGLQVAHARTNAKRTSAYEWFESEVASCIPSGARVLGLQHYWLGLRQYPYRTWLLPMAFASILGHGTAADFDAALERVDPDVVPGGPLLDDLMKTRPPRIRIRALRGFERSNPGGARR